MAQLSNSQEGTGHSRQQVALRLTDKISRIHRKNSSKQKTESLKGSDVLSRSLNRVGSVEDLRSSQKRSSLLHEIAEKLRTSKSKEGRDVSPQVPKRQKRVNKLNSIMSGIKECNKLSTKVVYSVKRTKASENPVPTDEQLEEKPASIHMSKVVNELLNLRKQVRQLRGENEMLKDIIRSNYFVKLDSGSWNVGLKVQEESATKKQKPLYFSQRGVKY